MSRHSWTRAAIVSYRLGTADGVSVTAAQWHTALRSLGMRVRTVAGAGQPDVTIPELAVGATRPPGRRALDAALGDADLVVVDNVCSLPLNPAAGRVLAAYLRGRPTVLRHHDLPWERPEATAGDDWPPDDPAWWHVTINDLARHELRRRRGIEATTIYHGFAERRRPEQREPVRDRLGVDGRRLLLQPTRAIARKNVPAGLALAESLDAVYWLTGPAEDGYAADLDRLLRRAGVPVRRGLPDGLTMAAAYAASDAVVLPSSWEGFGLPLVESALHRRPIAVGDFPVARELSAYGFGWFPADDAEPLRAWLADPDPVLLDRNEELGRRHFGIEALAGRIRALLAAGPSRPPAGGHDETGVMCATA